MSWSSGKDSTCALHLLHRDATVDVVGLLHCDVLSAREGPPRDRLGFDGTDRGGLLVHSLVFDLLTDLRHEGGHRDRQAVEHLIGDAQHRHRRRTIDGLYENWRRELLTGRDPA